MKFFPILYIFIQESCVRLVCSLQKQQGNICLHGLEIQLKLEKLVKNFFFFSPMGNKDQSLWGCFYSVWQNVIHIVQTGTITNLIFTRLVLEFWLCCIVSDCVCVCVCVRTLSLLHYCMHYFLCIGCLHKGSRADKGFFCLSSWPPVSSGHCSLNPIEPGLHRETPQWRIIMCLYCVCVCARVRTPQPLL